MEFDYEDYTSGITIMNLAGVQEFLKDIKFPIYFLDFEGIANSKQWMFNNGLDLDQQLSSFSLLKIESLNDDETKIKHFNFVGQPTNYEVMSKKITDFYKDNGSVVVWGRDLEVRGLAKLIKEAPESQHKKLSQMLANMIDLQQLFYDGSFIRIEPTGKSSLDTVAKAYGTYVSSRIKDGKKAHFILEHAIKPNVTESHLKNIDRRLEEYNNSDVINIKRILIEILKEV